MVWKSKNTREWRLNNQSTKKVKLCNLGSLTMQFFESLLRFNVIQTWTTNTTANVGTSPQRVITQNVLSPWRKVLENPRLMTAQKYLQETCGKSEEPLEKYDWSVVLWESCKPRRQSSFYALLLEFITKAEDALSILIAQFRYLIEMKWIHDIEFYFFTISGLWESIRRSVTHFVNHILNDFCLLLNVVVELWVSNVNLFFLSCVTFKRK